MDLEKLNGTLEKTADALERVVTSNISLINVICQWQGISNGELKKKPTEDELLKETEKSVTFFSASHNIEALGSVFGDSTRNSAASILDILPKLIDNLKKLSRYSRLIMEEETQGCVEQFNTMIDEVVAPEFVKIRDAMRSDQKAWDAYEQAREAAIVLFADEGPWHRNQGGTTFRVRSLLDNDKKAPSSADAYEQLLTVRMAVKFLEVLCQVAKEMKGESAAAPN